MLVAKLSVPVARDAPEATGEEPDDADLDMPKVYEPVESMDQLKARLLMFMQLYNESIRGAGMDLVFFHDAMVHLVKISRIIRMSRGQHSPPTPSPPQHRPASPSRNITVAIYSSIFTRQLTETMLISRNLLL